MKKIILLTLILVAGFAAKSQNSVVVQGTINNPVAGQTVWINYYGFTSGCLIQTSTTTNSAGEYSYNLNLGSCNYGDLTINMIGCTDMYDTLVQYGWYDSTVNGDTLTFDFRYCDTACRYFDVYTSFSGNYLTHQANFSAYNPYGTPSFTDYYWDFGDGNTSTSPLPNHTYSAAGNYLVKVVVQNTAKGCIDSSSRVVYMPQLDSIYVYGQIDTPINNKKVRVSYQNSLGLFEQALYTDATGAYGGWIITMDSSNKLYASISDCNNDSVTKSEPYSATTDSINIDFNYCPGINSCAGFEARFTYGITSRTVTFGNTSTSTANKFEWDFGDGQTSTSKYPVNVYAADGNYNVRLLARDTVSGCEDTVWHYVFVYTKASIYGRIILDSSDVIDSNDVIIYLIRADSVGSDILLTAVDSTVGSGYGYYGMAADPNERYFIKAALLSSSPHYANYIPTYFIQDALWSGATAINTVANSNHIANIQLIAGTNSGGPGFIGGYISVGANKTGDPIEKVQVLLLNASGLPITYVYTDANGYYSFTNLALGTYRVLVEIPGKPSEEYTETLDADNPGVTNRNFEVNTKDIKKKAGTTSVNTVVKNGFTIYPNPATTEITISLQAEKAGDIAITVTDITGKVIATENQSVSEGKNNIIVNVSRLANGLYIVNTQIDGKLFTGRISVNR